MKMYKVKYIVDGVAVLIAEVFLTKEDVKTLEAEGVVVQAKA